MTSSPVPIVAVRARRIRPPASAQRGAALMFAMLMLALMLVVGSGALETALVEQRVAANIRDRAAAFEGAEATALQSIDRLRWLTATGRSQPDETAGHYYGGRIAVNGRIADADNAPTRFWSGLSIDSANSLASSIGSGAPGLAPGRYIIERLQVDDEGEPSSPSTYPLTFSRVSTLASGANGANVLLQTIIVGLPE